ncbi:tetratricopeptide repeat protein [Sphingomonas aerolata]|uniref:tetratricopeptide repeat protein n=1 Tax=Sphingomonas aerolata TaxID=185951 RepID=UPI002FDFA52A
MVSELKEKDAKTYYYRLVEAYSVNSLKKSGSEEINRWLQELSFKPLLIKWFVLGVQSGLQPERIIANPETALRFCLDNVILTLGREAQAVLFVLATLPSPPGAGVIQQVGNLQAVQVGDGLAQLSRFGLIEASNLEDQGLVYNIKPFSRLYILRVINPKQSASDKIISRYREIESEFHSEKNRTINHYYSFKSYTIRSRSEMLIAKKLKEASGFAARGEFALADEILAEAKMLDPSYFETYRIESFVSQQQNDIPRALAAYSTAIKLGPDQPQLRFFYAGLLMRTGDNDSAADEFDAALEQDRTNGLVIREAARNKMIQYKWKEAQSLLDEALQIKVKEYREGIKLTDLQIQLYVRQMDALVKSDQLDPAVEIAVLLSSYLHSIDRNRFDSLTISHLAKALPPLRVVRAQLPGSAVVGSLIETLHRDFLPDDWRVSSSPPARANGEQFSGRLKRDGRKSGFGFLASQGVEDTFVHRGDVSPSLWAEMLSDALVTFEIDTNEGRRRARNVVKAN